MIKKFNPTDEDQWLELRASDITSTESAALFGCSPYTTTFELWHRKKNKTVVKLEENERMKWGTRLQDAIASGISIDKGWKCRRMDEYMRDPELRLGASFDFEIQDGAPEWPMGLLEVKNVDSLVFRDGWVESSEGIEAPPHIEIQVQHQLAVCGLDFAYIGALVGGNRLILLRRERQEAIIEAIKNKVAEFWETIDKNMVPEPNLDEDSKFIVKLYGYSSPGKILDISSDEVMLEQAREYRRLGEEMKERDKKCSAIKATFLQRIGDAEKVIGGQYTISAGMIGPTHVDYDRKGYRMFKLSWRKQK